MPSFNIGSTSFPTKTAAQAFVKGRLKAAKVGPVDPAVVSMLHGLLELHPDRDIKIGCGVSSFTIRRDRYGQKCFELTRLDGSQTAFSYIACFNRPSLHSQLIQGMRYVVAAEIQQAKEGWIARNGWGALRCAETGAPLRLADAHLDHRYPKTFAWIVACFLCGRRLDYHLWISPPRDNQEKVELIDPTFVREFQDFHREHAELDFVLKSVNMKQEKKQRTTPAHILLREAA